MKDFLKKIVGAQFQEFCGDKLVYVAGLSIAWIIYICSLKFLFYSISNVRFRIYEPHAIDPNSPRLMVTWDHSSYIRLSVTVDEIDKIRGCKDAIEKFCKIRKYPGEEVTSEELDEELKEIFVLGILKYLSSKIEIDVSLFMDMNKEKKRKEMREIIKNSRVELKEISRRKLEGNKNSKEKDLEFIECVKALKLLERELSGEKSVDYYVDFGCKWAFGKLGQMIENSAEQMKTLVMNVT